MADLNIVICSLIQQRCIVLYVSCMSGILLVLWVQLTFIVNDSFPLNWLLDALVSTSFLILILSFKS